MNELVLRACKGDMKAREELIEMLSPRLDRMVRKYAWASGIYAEDLKQDAYVAVIEGLDRVDVAIGSSSEYLLKFAQWRLLDILKKVYKRRCEELQDDEPESTSSDSGPGPEAEMLGNHLTTVQKLILQYLMEGYTWREIGYIMGFSAANVAHHLKQIRRIYG